MHRPLRSERQQAAAARAATMERQRSPALSASQRRRFHAAIAGAAAMLAILTLVTLLPGQRFSIANGALDVILNTLTGVVAAGAAALAWVRYRIEGDVSAVYESSAFMVLFATRTLVVGVAATGQAEAFGMVVEAHEQWPLYAWSLARLTSAALLLVAAAASMRQARSLPLPAWLVAIGPLVLLLVIFGGLRSLEATLPTFMGPQGFAALLGDVTAPAGMEPIGWVVQVLIAAAYLAAAARYHRIAEDQGRAYARYLTIALIVAGFSQVHWSLFPGIYRPLVTVDDLLRALLSVILLLGIGAQFRGDMRALRTANARLRALRSADAERGALETRARLAREVHDGLSQDLWLAKLKHARLAQVDTLPAEAQDLVAEVGEAVDRALSNARSVVETLRTASPDRSLDEAIHRLADEFEASSGIRMDTAGLLELARLEGGAEDELLRIVREALMNVEKHADATMVRMTVSRADDDASVVIAVADNGRGFAPSGSGATTFGLRGMQERAELIGGSVEVISRAADGTSVIIRVPMPDSARTDRDA